MKILNENGHGRLASEAIRGWRLISIVYLKRVAENSTECPPPVGDRGKLARYGGHWSNKISRVDQNQIR